MYTTTELASFMGRALGTSAGSVGGDLGPLYMGELEEVIPDVLARYGVATIAEATNTAKLQAIARARSWTWAVDQYVTRTKFSTDGQSIERQQLYDHAKERATYWEQQVAIALSQTPGSTTGLRPTMFGVASGCRGR